MTPLFTYVDILVFAPQSVFRCSLVNTYFKPNTWWQPNWDLFCLPGCKSTQVTLPHSGHTTTLRSRLRPEPDNPAGAGTGTGIPVPVCRNRMWIFKFRFRYERTGFIMSKFRFRFKEPELGHSNSGINRI